MKKLYLLLCVLGTILPYYHLINFLQNNQWSMDGFWNDIFYGTHSVSMITMDLTVAASTFMIYLIYQYKSKKIKISKYIICLFVVGFSLAFPLYLYDTHEN
jgi:hypothetical protein